MTKPAKENLWISACQASGLTEHHQRKNYSWDFSGEEPGLWPLEFYDDYSDDAMVQCFKQLNEFIRTDSKAAAFDGKKVSFDVKLPDGLDYDTAKQNFNNQGFDTPTVANWLSGSKTLTVQWTNYVVPDEDQALLEETKRVWNPDTDAKV